MISPSIKQNFIYLTGAAGIRDYTDSDIFVVQRLSKIAGNWSCVAQHKKKCRQQLLSFWYYSLTENKAY